ncbi:MAG TPA: DNA repair protein RecO [Gammaproteobacteria bacterium]
MSTDGRTLLQPAYVLHRKPYRDTSLLLEAFSPEYGRIGLVARGARSRRSTLQALLQPFQPLLLSWSGRGELHTLTAAEADGTATKPHGDALINGFYVNELLMRLLPRDDPHPGLYASYRQALSRLSQGDDHEWSLRLFERDLLQELGYGLQLTHEGGSAHPLQPERHYCYHAEYGPQAALDESPDCLAVSGATLLALATGEPAGESCRREAKRLMRVILGHYLGPRPLASRALFQARHAYSKRTEPTVDDEE